MNAPLTDRVTPRAMMGPYKPLAPEAINAQALTSLMPVLIRAARAITRDPDRAEDLAQDALLRVWAKLRAGAEIDDLRPYLLTTLRNLAKRPPRMAPVEAAPDDTTPAAAFDRITMHEVLEAVATLPADQAQLLTRAATGDGTMAELAEESGLPQGTVASRVSRGRARLRKHFDLPEANPVGALLDR